MSKQGTVQPGRSLFVGALVLSLAVALAGQPTAVSAAGQERVTVCHKPGTPAEMTLEISASAQAAHIAHGDYEGVCHPPVSPGCAELNLLVPDPQTNCCSYFFSAQGLTFFPGEVIHADITATLSDEGGTDIVVFDSSFGLLAQDQDSSVAATVTSSVDYTVVAGDNADGVNVSIFSFEDALPVTLEAVHISCTPAQ
jgi:hypothetical protein